MTDPGRTEPPAERLEAVLREASLTPPPRRPGSVSRAHLIRRARGSSFPVVGVTAPAGYGKSTLLSEWAEIEDRPVAWVSLAHLDDDPSVLVALLASAHAQISGNYQLVSEMGGLGLSILGRAVPRLASSFRTCPAPFVLMLDDLQELRSPASHDVLGVLISAIPQGSQMVTASRWEQPHLPRLRAQGDALELTTNDLALDVDGAKQIYALAQVTITDEAAEDVTVRTEGWPAGMYLAAMIAGDHGDVAATISGDDRFVADYLYRESLSQLPEGTQQFLRRTAVLDQLSADLCDAVMEGTGSQAHLHELDATNHFVVPLDRRRSWYRYHALYREFLLSELRVREPDLVISLHLRAADWYEANGSPMLALEHLLRTTARDRTVQLVSRLLMPTFQAGQLSTCDRWLSTLGTTTVEAYPPLAVLAGWAATMTGRAAESERWASYLDNVPIDPSTSDGSASFTSARAMYRAFICRDGPAQMMRDANVALEAEPAWSPWRAVGLHLRAEAHLLLGEVDSAVDALTETSRVAALQGNVNSVLMSRAELATVAMDRGQWSDANGHVKVALETITARALHDYAQSAVAFAAAARLAAHLGDQDERQLQLNRAMRARTLATHVMPYIAVPLRLQLAKVYASLADIATARHLLGEIDDILLLRPALGVLNAQVATFRSTLSGSIHLNTGVSPLTTAELRLLPYLQTHLTFREIGERLFVSRNTVSSQVSAIYRKLGVSSRSEAVVQATAIGMLGG